MFKQLKDFEFKILAKNKSKSLYGSDVEIRDNGMVFVIEYENSSRGLCANLLRILRIFDERQDSIRVLLIRTEHHKKTHHNDFKNCLKLISLVPQNEKIQITLMDGLDFQGFEVSYLRSLFSKVN